GHNRYAVDGQQPAILERIQAWVSHFNNEVVVLDYHDALEQATPDVAEIEFKAGKTVGDRGHRMRYGRVPPAAILKLRPSRAQVAGPRARIRADEWTSLHDSNNRIDLAARERQMARVCPAHQCRHLAARGVTKIPNLLGPAQQV